MESLSFTQATQRVLQVLAQDGDWVTLKWYNLANEPIFTIFRRAFSPRADFGSSVRQWRSAPDDVAVAEVTTYNDKETTADVLWGAPNDPTQCLQEAARYMELLHKNWRLVYVAASSSPRIGQVDSEYRPRFENAVKAAQRARAQARMRQFEEGERDLLDPQGKPATLQNLLASMFRGTSR